DVQELALGQVAVPDLAPARPAHRLVLAGRIRGHVVVVEVALLGLGADRVDALNVRGRAERRDGQRLGLTAGEQPRAVRTRQQADFDRNRPDVVEPAAVHPNTLVEHQLANGLLVDETDQAPAYTPRPPA